MQTLVDNKSIINKIINVWRFKSKKSLLDCQAKLFTWLEENVQIIASTQINGGWIRVNSVVHNKIVLMKKFIHFKILQNVLYCINLIKS